MATALVQNFNRKDRKINESVTYKYSNHPFAAQVERELGVSFWTGRDSIIKMYVQSTTY